MTARKVLVVDDDRNINELISLYFTKEGYEVESVQNGSHAIPVFHRFNPDLILLDLMLPGMDGYDICREIRRESQVPIIMLTARGETLDKVVGLELGADDYVQKPFEPQELVARVKAVLRRSEAKADGAGEKEPERVEFPGLVVDKSRYTVEVSGQTVEMPPKELELLFFLAAHPNRVFTREQLLGNVWGYDFFGESRTVDVHVKRIREKLEAISGDNPWSIKTVWGVGYKFDTES
ncbi:MAG: response regulator transcription factor [Clostridia bacterium]|nr:response regulator transcription factor [Clostridia bacterium]